MWASSTLWGAESRVIMKKLGLLVSCVLIGMVTVAIAAAPGTKKTSTARVAPPRTSGAAAGSDAIRPDRVGQLEGEVAPAPMDAAVPQTELSVPLGGEAGIPTATTAGSPAAAINMDWYSINNGGAIEVAAGNIKMGLSIGQSAVGEVSAGNIKMGLGFWYGASRASATCICECHADPACDSVTDIFDVTQLVNVAFRNEPAIPDPNVLCTSETTDVNCDGVTDIFDVTKMVNVAFRNGDPALEFCNPCIAAPNL